MGNCIVCGNEFTLGASWPVEEEKLCAMWECKVEFLKRAGNLVIAPNGLEITCINADGTLLEHEHANHKDYKFPIAVEVTDKELLQEYFEDYTIGGLLKPGTTIEDFPFEEWHAVIYTDGSVVVTLFECSYSIWSAGDGECLGGYCERGKWKIADKSLAMLEKYLGVEPLLQEQIAPTAQLSERGLQIQERMRIAAISEVEAHIAAGREVPGIHRDRK